MHEANEKVRNACVCVPSIVVGRSKHVCDIL